MPHAPLPFRRRFEPLTSATRRIYEMLACFEGGDYLGALAASDSVLGANATVFRVAASDVNRVTWRAPTPPISARAMYVLSLVEGQAGIRETLEELVDATGLPMLDALRCVCELVEARLLRIEIAELARASA